MSHYYLDTKYEFSGAGFGDQKNGPQSRRHQQV